MCQEARARATLWVQLGHEQALARLAQLALRPPAKTFPSARIPVSLTSLCSDLKPSEASWPLGCCLLPPAVSSPEAGRDPLWSAGASFGASEKHNARSAVSLAVRRREARSSEWLRQLEGAQEDEAAEAHPRSPAGAASKEALQAPMPVDQHHLLKNPRAAIQHFFKVRRVTRMRSGRILGQVYSAFPGLLQQL